MATQRSDLSPCPSCNCQGGCGCPCPCPSTPVVPAPSAPSTTAAADYLYNGGAPGGENFDLERSLQGKGLAIVTLTLAAPIGSNTLSVSSATGLKVGQQLYLSANGSGATFTLNGAGFEEVYVADTYVPGSLTVPLDSPTVAVHSAGDAVAYDAFTTAGPTTFGMLPTALEASVGAIFDPLDGLEKLARASSLDGASGSNVPEVGLGLVNGVLVGGTTNQLDRARSQSVTNTAIVQAGFTLPGVQLVNVPAGWLSTNAASGAAATTTKAAGAANVRHIVTSISVSAAAGATPLPPTLVQLLDGATPIWEQAISLVAGTSQQITLSGIAFAGSLGTALTLAFAGGTAGVEMTVNMSGYDIG